MNWKVLIVGLLVTVILVSGCIKQEVKCDQIEDPAKKFDCICKSEPDRAIAKCREMEYPMFSDLLCICAAVTAAKTDIKQALDICNLASLPSGCYDAVAAELAESNQLDTARDFCGLIEDGGNKASCLSNAASSAAEMKPQEAIEICSAFENSNQRDNCYKSIAYGVAKTDLIKALDICSQVVDFPGSTLGADMCYSNIAVFTLKQTNPEKAAEVCNMIQGRVMKAECTESLQG